MNKISNSKLLRLAALLAILTLLSGCMASIPVRQDGEQTLPPVATQYPAPLGDATDGLVQSVLLSLPNARTGRLEYLQERLLVSHHRHPAEYAIRRLFTYSGTTQTAPLCRETILSLNPGSAIEISGGTATVNLGPSALSISDQERYLVSRAIANTLAQWGDIHYVNVLINNRQPGLDTAATMPVGSLSRMSDGDIAGLWDAVSRKPALAGSPYTAMATLYYPVSAGRGIVAAPGLVSSQDHSLTGFVKALLEALSGQPEGLPIPVRVPDLLTMLAQEPVITEAAGATGRVIQLHFHESLNEALISAGIPRSVMMASLTYTLTTFVPLTSGLTVTIGQEPIMAVVPAGLYEGAGEEILFENGLMQRAQFNHFLLNYCTLYFANAQGSLSASLRPIPYYQAYNPRYLLGQLMLGPLNTDSTGGLAPVLPEGLKDADLLGLTRQQDMVLVNISGKLRELSKDMNAQEELLMVYAMVNTLTQQGTVRRVLLYLDGQQEGAVVHTLDLSGAFLRNEGIIQ